MTRRRWTNYFICERSGNAYPISQLVLEPGTGYKVHRKFCDFSYSLNKHPQNRPPTNLIDDSFLDNVRPDTQIDPMNYILDELYIAIIDEKGLPLVYN